MSRIQRITLVAEIYGDKAYAAEGATSKTLANLYDYVVRQKPGQTHFVFRLNKDNTWWVFPVDRIRTGYYRRAPGFSQGRSYIQVKDRATYNDLDVAIAATIMRQ